MSVFEHYLPERRLQAAATWEIAPLPRKRGVPKRRMRNLGEQCQDAPTIRFIWKKSVSILSIRGKNFPMKEKFMRAAIRLSLAKMKANCGGPFGAVVVRKGIIVGRGWNQVTSTNDPTAHAEVTAIRQACKKLKTFQLDDCELYTSCEPCPMCLSAIYWARFQKVYYANTRKDAAKIDFDDDLIYRELARPVSRRKIPMQQLLRPEALKVFTKWKSKPDKIAY